MKSAFALAAVLAFASPAVAQVAAPANATAGVDHSNMVMANGVGVVKSVDTKTNTVVIQHDPIAALKWPAMTMPFKAETPDVLKGVKAGQPVNFQVMQMGSVTTVTAIQAK
ncbi:MAG: copper-binding protein [Caulobacteraceae bacterium]